MEIPKNKHGQLIKRIKYLNDSKYYKNNVWSMAAWDSWAARGQAGECECCRAKFYNGSLENKRRTKENGRWQCYSIIKLCYNCINEIEKIIEYSFKKR